VASTVPTMRRTVDLEVAVCTTNLRWVVRC
jgi:hypothetical protein